ncbi:MAG: autotransporter domain-containing protein [Cyanobacteria bacterium J06629_19]
MRNYRRLSTFTLVLLFLSGAVRPFNFFIVEALAACTPQGNSPMQGDDPMSGALEPADGDSIICSDADINGIDGANAVGVTVTIESPDGSISVTDKPGIRLGNDATVTVEAPDRPVTVQGNDVPGIAVGNNSRVTVEGVVTTAGDFSPAITTGDGSTVTIDGGDGNRQIAPPGSANEGETEIVSPGGIVSTSGVQSNGVSVGLGSMVNAIGRAQISTTNSNSDAVVLNGTRSQLMVEENATVSTTGSMSSAVRMNGQNTQLNVAGTVRAEAVGTSTVAGAAESVSITVQDGGTITALASGSNAIELTSTGARIMVNNGGKVTVASGSSVAVIAGDNAVVTVSGQVSAAGAGSRGIVIGEGAELTVQSQGRIETSASAGEAVRISNNATMAAITVETGGAIAAGGQALVDAGETNTVATINGTVTGGGSEPVLALGGGSDTVTVNGSVTASGNQTVIDLGSGNDTLNNNSSQTIAGSGLLASGGGGLDTLNLNNGTTNDSANYTGFEVTNVGTNTTPGDPLNGNGSTLNVTNDQSGNVINVSPGSTLNVQNGGVVDLRADGSANPTGMAGNTIAFESGSTANIQVENVTGTQPVQSFTSTTFAPGTAVNTNSGFIRGVTSNDENTGIGQIELSSDFTNSARTSNGLSVGQALNAIADSSTLTAAQQTALNTLIEEASDTQEGEALLSNIAGEVRAQAAASGLNAAVHFNNSLLPSGNRTSSRGATIATDPDRAGRVFEQPAIGNGVWVSGLGSLLDVDRNDDSTGFDSNSYGVAVGYDRTANLGTFGTAVFGVGAGYSSTDVNGISDSASVNAFSLGTYFEASGPLSGHVAASYSSQDISSDVGDGGSGSLFAVSSEAFYNIRPASNLAVGPIGRLGAAFGNYGGFSTNNDAFGIDYEGADVSQVTGAVGVRIGGQSPVDVGFMALNLDLLYESSLGDNTVQFDGRLGEEEISITAPTTNQSGFFIGAEAALAISDATSIGFRYQGKLGSDIQSHSGEIKFSLLF